MPQSTSAKKRLRQSVRRGQANRGARSALRTRTRAFLNQVAQGKKDEAEAELRVVYSLLDKAAARGVVKKNYVARQKSRLTRRLIPLRQQ